MLIFKAKPLIIFMALLVLSLPAKAQSTSAAYADTSKNTENALPQNYILNQIYNAQDFFKFKLSEWENKKTLDEIKLKAQEGDIAAKWHLAMIYLKQEKGKPNKKKALKLFEELSNEHADIHPNDQNAPYISNAFVNMGLLNLDDVNGATTAQNKKSAKRAFEHAAIFFGDPIAQYQLAKMILSENPSQAERGAAMRWLKLAARKNNTQAQATLGKELFDTQKASQKRRAAGLYWMQRAKDSAKADEAWIGAAHEKMLSQATQDEIEMAQNFANRRKANNIEKLGD